MKFRLLNFGDHRTAEQKARGQQVEQALADARVELEWQRRVQVNILRRQFGEVALLKRQAN